MQSLILAMAVSAICGQNLVNKLYNQNGQGQNVYIHSGVCSFTAMLFFYNNLSIKC